MRTITYILLLMILAFPGNAQTIINRDPEIKRMADAISKERIEQHVRKMVSFQTRHNMSG